jgi:DNA invertase Pin-like site-specific DNA recombinase
MTKITPEHLLRSAIVYVRQSTAYQVTNNLESQRRQYGLVERARQLGWSEVRVIDDDLGRSGGGIERPGFEKVLAAICEGGVGAVLSIEASRLARNGRDWHTLLEFCGGARTSSACSSLTSVPISRSPARSMTSGKCARAES